MGTTIGEIILAVRRQIPDMPQALTAPVDGLTQLTATGVNLTNGAFKTGQQIWFVITGVDAFGGETIASAEDTITLSGAQNALQFVSAGHKIAAGTVAYNIYFGAGAGAEDQFVQTDSSFNAVLLGFNAPNNVISGTAAGAVPSNGVPGNPPSRNTAFNPETDGNFFSASSMYQMLNDSFDELMRIGGGITDVTGAQAVNSVLSYRLPAGFFNYTDVWYDGWPLEIVKRAAIFMRNPVPGIVGYVSLEHDGISTVLSMFPQPSRTGNVTTLTASMAASDTLANISAWPNPGPGGAPGMGVAQIGAEQVIFSGIGTSPVQLTGLLRGVGGTQPMAHNSGETVTEFNIRLVGKRTVPKVARGSAALTLNVPPAWERACKFYIMSLVRKAEQDPAAAAEELKQFNEQVKLLTAMSKQKTQPRRILVGDESPEVYSPNAFGFGWIIN